MWAGMLIALASFALMHGYKSAAGIVRSGLMGAVVAIPVLATGTLLPSIVAHALQDVIAGNVMLPLARGLGVAIPSESSSGAAPVAEPAVPTAPVAERAFAARRRAGRPCGAVAPPWSFRAATWDTCGSRNPDRGRRCRGSRTRRESGRRSQGPRRCQEP
jgi:hypothetical protein